MPKYASPEEQKIDNLRPKHNKLVEEAPYHPGYEDAVVCPFKENVIAGAEQQGDDDKGYEEANLADAIRFQMKREGKRFWAGDNISEYVDDYRKQILIN